MAKAKDILIRPVTSEAAHALVKRLHYSGKTVNNSQLHLGAFLNDRLEGVMQFGPSLDKRKLVGLVRDTAWHGFLELNRMAFSEALPRNSESRALGVAMRMLKRQYPHLEWIVSFADACQCGDGTIYRAAGFVLTDVRPNNALWRLLDGRVVHKLNYEPARMNGDYAKERAGGDVSRAGTSYLRSVGAVPVEGFQLRYVYFLNPASRARLTVPEIPFGRIADLGAGMARGEKRAKQAMAGSTGTAAGQNRPARSISTIEASA